MGTEKFTLGVEEEYMVVNPLTRELASHDQKIVEIASKVLNDQVKAEMHQAVVEVGSGICKDAEEARKDITRLRTDAYPKPRYEVQDFLQSCARCRSDFCRTGEF